MWVVWGKVVLDMRGPNVRMTTLDKLKQGGGMSDGDDELFSPTRSAHSLPEVQHNVRLLVDLTEDEILTINRKIQHCEDSITALERDRAAAERAAAVEEQRARALEAALSMVQRCEGRLEEIKVRVLMGHCWCVPRSPIV